MDNGILWGFIGCFILAFGLLIVARRKTIAGILKTAHDEHDCEIYEDSDKENRTPVPGDFNFRSGK